jgi:hypothetical protein
MQAIVSPLMAGIGAQPGSESSTIGFTGLARLHQCQPFAALALDPFDVASHS